MIKLFMYLFGDALLVACYALFAAVVAYNCFY